MRIWETRLDDALRLRRAEDRRRRVRPLVKALFEEHQFLTDPVVAALGIDPTLAPGLRSAALQVARSQGPTALELNDVAWALVSPDRHDRKSDVVLGLRMAQRAVALAPEDSATRDTLAWALFANDRHEEALGASEAALALASEDRTSTYEAALQRLRDLIAEAD